MRYKEIVEELISIEMTRSGKIILEGLSLIVTTVGAISYFTFHSLPVKD